ncbi:MAG TPA: HWE histidine kinase domain-containing protein [Acetobacteraceae bacterium]|nr:HWE histidine kinase domain-containing protein [Acetobacteraceae bacterium]
MTGHGVSARSGWCDGWRVGRPGEMAARIRAHDWAATPLGPPLAWPDCLRAIVDMALACGFPMAVLWGADLVQIYNDGFRELIGPRHPGGLGQPFRRCWPEAWEASAPVFERVRAGETLTFDDEKGPLPRLGAAEEAWFARSYSPLRDGGGTVSGVLVTAFETTARRLAERRGQRAEVRLRQSERRLRTLVEGIPQFVWRAAEDGAWIWAGPKWCRFTGLGLRASFGHGWLEAVHPEDREAAFAAWDAAARSGRFEAEFRLRRACDGGFRWFRTRALPVRDAEGRILEWLGISTDVEEARSLRDRQAVMMLELQHRTRNLMTVVLSVARQTIARTTTREEFAEAFEARLGALARAQNLLSGAAEEPVTLRMLLWIELEALCAERLRERLRLDGPEVTLRKTAVQTLILAIHELADNAQRHGALGRPGGRLEICWRIIPGPDGGRLVLDWAEHGVPIPGPVREAARTGYGRELIERALPYSLGGETRFDLTEDGAHCEIALPVTAREGMPVAG